MKKMFIVSTLMALVVASLSAFSVFAAPSTSSRVWGAHFDQLQADRVFYDHFVANHKNFVKPSDPIKLQVYLARYAADLSQAQAIIANPANTEALNTKNMTSRQVNSQDQTHQTAVQDLATLLHDMRNLQRRLVQIGYGKLTTGSPRRDF